MGIPPGVLGQWERAISMHRTSWSFVLEAKPNGRSITWFGWDAPHGTAYLPFYAAATLGAPNSYSGSHSMAKFSTDTAWWAFNLVNQYQDLNFAVINKEVREKAKDIEAEGQRNVAAWEREADQLSPTDALDLLTARSNHFAGQKVNEWWAFAWKLIAKYRGYVITYNETMTGENVSGQAYPAWWLESPEVGFTTWSNMQSHGILLNASSLTLSTDGGGLHAISPQLSGMLFALFLLSMLVVGVTAHKAGVRKGRKECSMGGYYMVQP